jgi:DNA polymerase-3 subunit gamma/tau
MMAAEMAVIRLTHVAELPSPEELLRRLQDAPPPPPPGGPGGGGAAAPGHGGGGGGGTVQAQGMPAPTHAGPQGPSAAQGNTVVALAAEQALARYPTFEHVLDLIRANRDVQLLVEVEGGLRLAAYQPGRIEFTPTETAPGDLAQRLGVALQRWTGNRWAVTLVNGCETQTVTERRDAARLAIEEKARAHPLVQAALSAFPKARIKSVKTPEEAQTEAQLDALPEVEDEWDPFEEE